MDLKINGSTNFKGRPDILKRLIVSSLVTRNLDQLHLRDVSFGKEVHKNNAVYKRPIFFFVERIVNDCDFTKSVVDTFTKEELEPVKYNLDKISNTQGLKEPSLLFKAFFDEYLTKEFLKSDKSNINEFNLKTDALNSLIEKLK